MFSALLNPHTSGLLAMMLVSASSAAGASNAPLRTDHLSSQLVAERATATPGQSLRIGLHLQHDPHWHTYWQNPGDSGLPTRIELRLPDGVTASAIEWPTPERFDVEGIVNIGYSDRIILPITLSIPADFSAAELEISASASWLICEIECIPGRGDYQIRLPVVPPDSPSSNALATAWSEDFAAAAKRQPTQFFGSAQLTQKDDRIVINLRDTSLPTDIAAWEVFAVNPQVVVNAPYPMWRRIDGGLQMTMPQSEYFAGLPSRFSFLLAKGGQALAIDADVTPKP